MHLVFMYFHFISGDTESERSLPFACSRPHSPTAEVGPGQAGLGASRSPRGGAGGILVLESSLAAPRCSSAGTGVRVQPGLRGSRRCVRDQAPPEGSPCCAHASPGSSTWCSPAVLRLRDPRALLGLRSPTLLRSPENSGLRALPLSVFTVWEIPAKEVYKPALVHPKQQAAPYPSACT